MAQWGRKRENAQITFQTGRKRRHKGSVPPYWKNEKFVRRMSVRPGEGLNLGGRKDSEPFYTHWASSKKFRNPC